MDHIRYHNEDLWVEDVPVSKMIEALGTPLYIYSHASLIKNWQAFEGALGSHPHKICYAVKANSNLAVLNTLAKLGSSFDIVSGGELARVIKAGGNPKEVVFSGVGKQPEEMEQALLNNIFCFNVESPAELLTLNSVAKYLNLQAPIAFRVNPDVDANSHPYISTGLKESKFGINIDQAPLLYQQAAQLSHVKIKGLACHIGSQITTLSPFIDAFKRLLHLHSQLKSLNIPIHHIDIGGGLGVTYRNEMPPLPSDYASELLKLCTDPNLTLLIEPGRAIAANVGILVTKILTLKDAGNKQYCVVDCAMNDFIRPSLYSAWHDIIPVKKSQNDISVIYDIVGPICESGDFLGKDRSLSVNQGDCLAICDVGAYGFVTSSNYNSRPRAAEVLVKESEFKVVRQRETVEQLFALENLW